MLSSRFSSFRSLFPQYVKVTLVFDCPSGATLTCSFKMMCSSVPVPNTLLLLGEVHAADQWEEPILAKVPREL